MNEERTATVRVTEPETALCLVADRFAGFAADDRVETVSGLHTRIADGGLDGLDALVLYQGQGVADADCERIRAAFGLRNPLGEVRVVGHAGRPLPPGTVHKRAPENVLLGNLRRTATSSFAADLRIQPGNELLLDHQTGEHVQGMVVIEALRQICIGIFETGYHDRWPARRYFGAWKSISLSFDEFLFPLPAEIRTVVHELDLGTPANLKFQLDGTVVQGGRAVATSRITFAMLDADRVAKVERRKARHALDAYLAEVKPVHGG